MDNKNDTTDTPDTQEWPNTVHTRDELDSALEAGEKSGVSPYTIDEIVAQTLAELKADGVI